MRIAFVCAWMLVFGCDDKKPTSATERGSGGGSAGGSGSGSGSGTVVAERPPPPRDAAPDAPTAAPPAPAEPELPLSTDVLPKGEATPNARVVSGDGFLFQIPQSFRRVDRDGVAAYAGTVKGFVADAPITFWAQSEPFSGDLAALVERETGAAAKAGASADKPDSVMIFVAGTIDRSVARRMKITFADRIEMRTVAVRSGKAYIHHCETPNVPNAWANVGSDCVARSSSFHLAPPALGAAPETASGPAPPKTAGVVFMGSKVEGKARDKAAIRPWLESSVVPYLKPCVKALSQYTTWKIAFVIAKDGSPGTSTIVGGPSNEDDKPGSASAVACVANALAAVTKLDGEVKDAVKVTVALMNNPAAD